MEIGYIYKSDMHGHCFVLIYEYVGCMLTHSDRFDDNIKLSETDFKKEDSNGMRYEFQFDNTYFKSKKLLKREEFGPYIKVGEMTDEGLSKVWDAIKGQFPKDFVSPQDKRKRNRL